ncbi:MAG: AraC family transcriptional regulator ligand-binding domain-containing protein [Bauldia sp.]|nr:AraC family transcriptional regulator ligand-binding domain-containing protein [Bauldia sp.]
MSGVEFTRVPTLPHIVEAVRSQVGQRAVARCFAAMDLREEVVCAPGAVLPLRDLLGLLEWFARISGDPLFGLFAARALKPGSFGLFVDYALQAPTVAGSALRASRGVSLHQTGTRLGINVADGTATYHYRIELPLTVGRDHHAIHALVQLMGALEQYLGFRPPLIEVGFEAARYGSATEVEDLFGVPVRWNAKTNYFRFPASFLGAGPATTNAYQNPVTWSDLLRYARSVPPKTSTQKTEAALRMHLDDEELSAETIARYLNMGTRTLQRRLAVEGVSFRDVVAQVRRTRAIELLTESEAPLWRVAELLGYSEQAHFTRAFRQWTGRTPSEFRRAREGRRSA